MNPFPTKKTADLEKLIMQHIPRDFLLACEDAYYDGDKKGRQHAAAFMPGHRPSASGQNKHFFSNETFYEAFLAHGANPNQPHGTRLVTARMGIFNVARLNVPGHKWVNIKRSATRKKLAELNLHLQQEYVQGDLFLPQTEVAQATIFILGVMDGFDQNGLAQLTQVMLALPAPDMRSWLYIRSIPDFVALYEQPETTTQPDTAIPTLKKQLTKQTENDQRN